MAVKWTDEQQRAIETTDRGVVVPAAAGSGKTAVLIERTVRLLADSSADCPAERLLAVTFTKDAANQMKTKLRGALTERTAAESDPEARRWLERQCEMLSLAKISTINSFCLELVKSHLNEFDYRAGIRVADDTQTAVITDEAMAAALEETRREDPQGAELLIDALTNNSDTELSRQVYDFYKFLCSLPFPEDWIEKTQAGFTDGEKLRRDVEIFMYEVQGAVDKAVRCQQQEAQLCLKLGNSESALKAAAADLDSLESMRAAVNTGDYELLYDALEGIKFVTMRKPSEKNLTTEEVIAQQEVFEQIKKVREAMKNSIKRLTTSVHTMGRDIGAAMAHAGEIFAALCGATMRFQKILNEIKLERGVADFSDIERMAMRLLVTNESGQARRTPLAEEIVRSGAYKVILIDEYQDVNNLQETIFRALSTSQDMAALGSNIFVVGDVKQAIYRFRLSNPRLFLKAAKQADADETGALCKIRLTRNFRSRAGVIDFVNSVFRALMSEELGELEYTEDEELRCGAHYGGEDKPTELMLIRTAEQENEELKYYIFGEEELCIARRIRQMIESGEQVWKGDEARACTAGDFCVLSRGKEGCRRIAAALEYVGLKAQSEQTDGYMGAKEIITMVNLLKIIDDPMKDLPMAGVMMSPIFSFTAEETAKLRLLSRADDKPLRLYQMILAASKTESADAKETERIELNNDVLEEKCRRAAALIKRLRSYSVSMSLEALISAIYDETGFFAVASIYENSAQRRANLRLLTQRAAEYEKDSTGGIAGFLRFLDSLSAAGGDFAQALTVTADGSCVEVKTIHSSKGLEYPFVFLTNIDRSFNRSDLSQKILLNERLGAGINYMRHDKLLKVRTIAHAALESITEGEQLSEELRLLYVALTRAKERLFIPITIKHNKNSQYDTPTVLSNLALSIMREGGVSAKLLRGCKSYQEWLAAVIMISDRNRPLLEELELGDIAGDLSMGSGVRLKAVWGEYSADGGDAPVQKRFETPEGDPAAAAALREKYEFVYPNATAMAAAKRTVTEIVSELRRAKEGDADPMFYPQLGTLDEEAKRLTAAEKGTYTHLFMELADYENAEKSVSGELERLVEKGIFSERESKGVYKGAVQKYFESDFYRRVKASEDVRREMQFMVRADDAGLDKQFPELIAPDGMLQGVCDCIFKDGEGYILVDYKTDNFAEISEALRYKVQLKLYKAALDLILPLPVKACYIYSFRLSQGIEISL